MSERFRYNHTSQMIRDNLTGFTYHGNQELCDLLNYENDRADKIAEKYYKLKEECRFLKFEANTIK